MSSTLTALQETMTAFLEGQGVRALSAWPKEVRKVQETPLAVVAVQEAEGQAAGFGGYLGEVFRQGGWQEARGQKLRVCFALDLYSPPKAGEEGCRGLLDQVVRAVQMDRPGGLSMESWTMGETGFDRQKGMFHGRLLLRCSGVLMEEEEDRGAFLGFEVKGGVTIDRDHKS